MSCEDSFYRGYGIKLSDCKVIDTDHGYAWSLDSDRIWNLLELDDDLSDCVADHLYQDDRPNAVNDIDCIVEETEWYMEDYRPGIAGILSILIELKENVSLTPLLDEDDEEYLLLIPPYPWDDISGRRRNLSKEELQEVISKYLAIISDATPVFDYYDVIKYDL